MHAHAASGSGGAGPPSAAMAAEQQPQQHQQQPVPASGGRLARSIPTIYPLPSKLVSTTRDEREQSALRCLRVSCQWRPAAAAGGAGSAAA